MRSLVGDGKPRYLAVLAERICVAHFIMRWFDEMSQRLNTPSRTIDNEKLPARVVAA
jgi:hypothetical protein